MDDPTTKPSGSKPASPSSTYSETDRSEVKTPPAAEPAVCARRPSAASGSQVAPGPAGLENKGMTSPSGRAPPGAETAGAQPTGRAAATRPGAPRLGEGRVNAPLTPVFGGVTMIQSRLESFPTKAVPLWEVPVRTPDRPTIADVAALAGVGT